jgi:hypothetical protein
MKSLKRVSLFLIGLGTRSIEAGDQSYSDGIGTGRENDRNGSGCRLRRACGNIAASRKDDRNLSAYEIGHHCWYPIVPAAGGGGQATGPSRLGGDEQMFGGGTF